MHLKALEKVIEKLEEAASDLIGNEIVKSLNKMKLLSLNRIIWKKLQMSMIKKYLKKDIYFQRKDRK